MHSCLWQNLRTIFFHQSCNLSPYVLFPIQNMVKSFRVSDLQTLLASMGRSKSGLKQDLVGRALRLVQTEYSPELLKNVRQLYESRFPRTSGWLAARRPEGLPVSYSSLSSTPSATSQGAEYLNGITKPMATPAPEVKLVPLPFYQTLETLLPPTELGELYALIHLTANQPHLPWLQFLILTFWRRQILTIDHVWHSRVNSGFHHRGKWQIACIRHVRERFTNDNIVDQVDPDSIGVLLRAEVC